ncbi:hypothetical protein BBFGKLBO_00717 [Synechococcus sp. CBW1107]|jgi:hypothetical protein|nr:hypothetical protein BBFGKLBO_00717 [Synechococcus sp. CBW1107]
MWLVTPSSEALADLAFFTSAIQLRVTMVQQHLALFPEDDLPASILQASRIHHASFLSDRSGPEHVRALLAVDGGAIT